MECYLYGHSRYYISDRYQLTQQTSQYPQCSVEHIAVFVARIDQTQPYIECINLIGPILQQKSQTIINLSDISKFSRSKQCIVDNNFTSNQISFWSVEYSEMVKGALFLHFGTYITIYNQFSVCYDNMLLITDLNIIVPYCVTDQFHPQTCIGQ